MNLSSNRLLYLNDEAGKYPQSYYAATTALMIEPAELKGALDCDVCVIGAGFTGLSTALHLAEKGFKVSVVEAHRVGWGASGRNGGQLGIAQRQDQEELEKMVGLDEAKKLWSIGREANQLVKNLIKTHEIDCGFKAGLLYTDHKKSYSTDTKNHISHMEEVYDYDGLEFYDQGRVRECIGTKSYFSGYMNKDGGHLHPLKYAIGLAKACISAGVSIYEFSPVERVEGTKILTKFGSLQAKSVVYATNGYMGKLEPEVARNVMPINNFILATEPLSDKLANEVINGDFGVADSKFVVNYYRKSEDNRLLFGGGETYSYKFPTDIKAFVQKKMLEIYPQLSDTRIDYGWGGTLAITTNRMPYVKQLAPNIWNASGYSGSGVGMATMCGKLLAEAVEGNLTRFNTMANIPSMAFPGGALLRWPILALAMTYYGIRDRL